MSESQGLFNAYARVLVLPRELLAGVPNPLLWSAPQALKPFSPLAAFKGRPAVAPGSAAALQGQLEARMWAAADAAVLVRAQQLVAV